jgi:peptidylprolyl isomerase
MRKPIQFTLIALGIIAITGCQHTASKASDTAKASAAVSAKGKTMSEILQLSKPEEWRTLDPKQLLVMDLPAGRVVIELAEQFAPMHSKNLRLLANEAYFDGLAIVRSQDNFVVQWGDPNADKSELRKAITSAERTLKAEFTVPYQANTAFTRLPDADGYAAEVGFSNGFAVGRDPSSKTMWAAHCYGVVGAGRDTDVDSGGGTELYVVSGHAPRQLDRNITVVGRVVAGMEFLSTVVRGPAPMGFYEDAKLRTTITSLRLASSLPTDQQPQLQQLKTDSQSFIDVIEARRNRRDDWYKVPAGCIDLCNVPLPVRKLPN